MRQEPEPGLVISYSLFVCRHEVAADAAVASDRHRFALRLLFVASEAKKPPPPGLPVKPEAPVPPPDTDGDGVSDDLDLCGDTPAGVWVNRSGCEPDGDGDGQPDRPPRAADSAYKRPYVRRRVR